MSDKKKIDKKSVLEILIWFFRVIFAYIILGFLYYFSYFVHRLEAIGYHANIPVPMLEQICSFFYETFTNYYLLQILVGLNFLFFIVLIYLFYKKMLFTGMDLKEKIYNIQCILMGNLLLVIVVSIMFLISSIPSIYCIMMGIYRVLEKIEPLSH